MPKDKVGDLRLNLSSRKRGFDLIAVEVASDKERWRTRHEAATSGPYLFSPAGRFLLAPEQGSDLLLYRVQDGVLAQRWSIGLV